jgi:hypothetical protein
MFLDTSGMSDKQKNALSFAATNCWWRNKYRDTWAAWATWVVVELWYSCELDNCVMKVKI